MSAKLNQAEKTRLLELINEILGRQTSEACQKDGDTYGWLCLLYTSLREKQIKIHGNFNGKLLADLLEEDLMEVREEELIAA